MGILNDVLQWKQYKEAKEAQTANAIPQAVNAFIQGRQQQIENQNSILKTQIDAAKAGFRIENGGLVQDPNLMENAQRGVFGFNPLTGNLERVGVIKKGDVVRNQMSTEDIQAKQNAVYGGTKETASRAFDLRKEFQSIPTVKDFQVIKNQVGAMDSLLKSIDTDKQSALALDQGLITLFNKITDPQSVVRESEYERTPQNLSLVNRFSGAFEKLSKGGAGMTRADREALVFGAKVIADSRGQEYNNTLSNYKNLSTEFGVKPDLVIGGYGEHKPYLSGNESQKGVLTSSIPDGTTGTYKGQPVVRRGGKWELA